MPAPKSRFKAPTGTAHLASQVGAYGLGTAGYEAASELGHLIPGGGLGVRALRFGMGLVGGAGGGVGGIIGGQAVGRAAGDKSPEAPQSLGQAAGRGLGGLGAQTLTSKFIAPAASKAILGSAAARAVSGGIRGAAGRVAGGITRVATRGLGARIGGAIGQTLGGIGGAAAGTVVEPGGGTVAGGVGGRILGGAIGVGAGILADEGIGYLYRHLSHYGAHVPDMAAKHLGVPAHVRAKHANVATVA